MMKILVINVSSTSVKYDVYEMHPTRAGAATEQRVAHGVLDRLDGRDLRPAGSAAEWQRGSIDSEAAIDRAIHDVFDQLGPHREGLAAIGHRVVHGGEQLVQPVRIDAAVEAAIDACSLFAPLHNPLNLRGIRLAQQRFPGLPHVAVFDTAFHAELPEHAFLYALPYELYLMYGIRRYGFHGPSHQLMAARVAEHLQVEPSRPRIISCHLGSDASVAAIRGGVSIDTSMGLTPLEGLVMGSGAGDLDPAIPGILEELGYTPAQRDALLNHESGVAGLSGLGADFRELEAAAERGHARARLAIEVYVHRIRKYLGAYAVALGGADAVVFTGGIGEHSAQVRARVCANLGFMGITVDVERNRQAQVTAEHGVAEISERGGRTRVLVVHAEEARMVAREVARCLYQ